MSPTLRVSRGSLSTPGRSATAAAVAHNVRQSAMPDPGGDNGNGSDGSDDSDDGDGADMSPASDDAIDGDDNPDRGIEAPDRAPPS